MVGVGLYHSIMACVITSGYVYICLQFGMISETDPLIDKKECMEELEHTIPHSSLSFSVNQKLIQIFVNKTCSQN